MSSGFELRVVAQRVAGHVLHLGQRLDAGVAAADEDEGQRPAADLRVGRGGRHVEPVQHVVAQVDGLTDGLEADAVLAQAGDRQRPGDRAGGDDDVVVRDLPGRAADRLHDRGLAGVVDPGHRAGDDLALAQLPPQRHHGVPGRDVAGRRLGQERLVGHVRLRVDDDDLGLTGAELLGQAQGGVEADVPGTHHKDPLRVHVIYLSPGGSANPARDPRL